VSGDGFGLRFGFGFGGVSNRFGRRRGFRFNLRFNDRLGHDRNFFDNRLGLNCDRLFDRDRSLVGDFE
jgi:hypothetical protein